MARSLMQPRPGRLADIQARQIEVGRIRLGTSEQKQGRRGAYNAPVKLDRFRLTGRSEALIRQAAQLYGGEVGQWTPQSGGAAQWEVIIEATSLAVIVPPNSCSQFYEQWSGGKCTRRCDGAQELLTMQVCPCGPDPDAKKAAGCKPTTRLSLMLAELPGIGVWRLESHGYNAALELPAIADLLSRAGGNIPARLEMEERSSLVPDPRDASKTVTSRFMVPVLHVEATPAQILGNFADRLALGGTTTPPAGQPPALPSAERTALPAAPSRDWPTEIAATNDKPTLSNLWRECVRLNEMDDIVKGWFEQRAAQIDQAQQQWTVHAWFEDRINQASGQGLTALAEQIRNEKRLLPQFRDSLLDIVAHRVGTLSEIETPPWEPPGELGDTFESPVETYGGRPVQEVQLPAPGSSLAAAAAPELDRMAVWTTLNLLAAQRGLTQSKLRAEYHTWSQGRDLTQALAAEIRDFHQWLEGK